MASYEMPDEVRARYVAEAVVEKFRSDLKEALRPYAEEALDEACKRIVEDLELDARGALFMDWSHGPVMKVLIQMRDKRKSDDC